MFKCFVTYKSLNISLTTTDLFYGLALYLENPSPVISDITFHISLLILVPISYF